jgi:hypothetical protein
MADDVLTKVELVYIKNVAEKLGVPLKELESFTADEPELELPDKEFKIYALFHRLAIIIMIDENASEKEKTYCFNLGVKMGLHPSAIREIIDHVVARGAFAAMPKDIMAIFKKYMN